MTEIALSSVPKLVMLPLPHTSPNSLFIFIYIFRHLGIFFLERKKKVYSFHHNILDYVPEKITILSSYASWPSSIQTLSSLDGK